MAMTDQERRAKYNARRRAEYAANPGKFKVQKQLAAQRAVAIRNPKYCDCGSSSKCTNSHLRADGTLHRTRVCLLCGFTWITAEMRMVDMASLKDKAESIDTFKRAAQALAAHGDKS